MAQLRQVAEEDRATLYEICLRTGNQGGDARDLYRYPELLGDIYVGPYLELAPACCHVIEDDLGVGGYVVGASDTIGFEQVCTIRWWPGLQRRYPLSLTTGSATESARLRQIHAPRRTPSTLTASYPAHLHINLLPRLQGRGFGRQLIDHFRAVAAEQGAPGLHLIAGIENTRACAFYHHYGFRELGRQQGAVAFGIATA